MISDPNLVHYACIAHNTTVLAEFDPTDSPLQSLAQKCLHQTPPHHLIFTQTTQNRTYTFLIDDPFVYFGIFDETLSKSDQFLFLNRIKDSMFKVIGTKSKWVNGSFSSYCIQDEFHPIFRKLLSKSLDFDSIDGGSNGLSPNEDHYNGVKKREERKKVLSVPLLAQKKKKEERLFGQSEEMLVKDEDELSDDGDVISRELCPKEGGGGGGGRRQKAKKIWRRHVWIVLIVDLAVCLILFGIWLWFCQGFECVVDG